MYFGWSWGGPGGSWGGPKGGPGGGSPGIPPRWIVERGRGEAEPQIPPYVFQRFVDRVMDIGVRKSCEILRSRMQKSLICSYFLFSGSISSDAGRSGEVPGVVGGVGGEDIMRFLMEIHEK